MKRKHAVYGEDGDVCANCGLPVEPTECHCTTCGRRERAPDLFVVRERARAIMEAWPLYRLVGREVMDGPSEITRAKCVTDGRRPKVDIFGSLTDDKY